MDKTTFIGRLTADPVRRETSSGKELADFTVAVDRGYGEHKTTVFFRCTAWEKKSEPILRYLHKGDQVYVDGQVSATAYNTSDGKPKASLEIRVDNYQFLQTARREETHTDVTPDSAPEDFTPVQEELPF